MKGELVQRKNRCCSFSCYGCGFFDRLQEEKKQHQCGKFGRDYKPKSGSGSGNAGSDCHTCTDGYACTDRHAR